jgi:hypothetical protein
MGWPLSEKQYKSILLASVVLMALVAVPWLTLNFQKLVWQQPPWGAVDLKHRYNEVQRWFAGEPIYSKLGRAVYPPASYAMLWPVLGWLPFAATRIVWAALTAIALCGLAYFFAKESGAQTRLEQAFVVLMALSMYATGFSFGHGQLTIPVLSALVAGITRVGRTQASWQNDLVAAALILIALVKPPLAVPFFWLVIFLPRRLRPAQLVVIGYIALTLIAIQFQGSDLVSLHHSWSKRAVGGAAWGAETGGYGDLHAWLALLGLKQWNLPASLVVLLALGWWTYRYRQSDVWLLLGVTAIVARFWAYHRAYDDMLILFPMVALFRTIKQDPLMNSRDGMAACILLGVAMVVMFAPALLYVKPAWEPLLKEVQTPVRIAMLIFLVYRVSCESNTSRRALSANVDETLTRQ